MVDHALSGRRIVDRLLQQIPQEVAATTDFVQDVNGELFLACTTNESVDHSSVGELSAQEYEVLLLASRGLSYAAIEVDLGIAESTVRTHLNKVYKVTDTYSKAQAGALIPMPESELRSVTLWQNNEHGERISKLSRKEQDLFDGLAQSNPVSQIAYDRSVTPSTVRAQVVSTNRKLGLSNMVETARLAGAYRNLGRYAEMVGSIASSIQPPLVEFVESPKVTKIKGLEGKIATILVRKLGIQADLLPIELMWSIVKTVVDHETAGYYAQHSEDLAKAS